MNSCALNFGGLCPHTSPGLQSCRSSPTIKNRGRSDYIVNLNATYSECLVTYDQVERKYLLVLPCEADIAYKMGRLSFLCYSCSNTSSQDIYDKRLFWVIYSNSKPRHWAVTSYNTQRARRGAAGACKRLLKSSVWRFIHQDPPSSTPHTVFKKRRIPLTFPHLVTPLQVSVALVEGVAQP